MVWIDAFKLGSTIYHHTGDVEITHDFAIKLVDNFDRVKTKGYAVTFLREHGRQDSYVYGDIQGMRIEGGYVQCAVDMTRQEERDAYNAGIMREFSPGFHLNWQDPHTGEKIGPVLLELSFTSMAHQRNLRKPQDVNPGVVLSGHPQFTQRQQGVIHMADEKMAAEEVTAEKTDVAEPTMADFMLILNEIKTMLAQKEKEPEVEMSEEEDKVAQMSARIEQLEDEKTRMELSVAGITGEPVCRLVRLARNDAELFKQTVKLLSARPQVEVGVSGSAEVGTKQFSAADVAAEAVKAGKAGHGSLALFVQRNHPDFDINDVRKALNN